MGYCYARGGGLVCDACSSPGAVKRPCAYKVSGLPYCPAPALCSPCYARLGGLRGVHGDRCRDGAAQSQAQDDARKASMAAGEMFARSAFGDWKEGVPAGMAGVMFAGKDGEAWYLVDGEAYTAVQRRSSAGSIPLSAFPDAQAWADNPDAAKAVATS